MLPILYSVTSNIGLIKRLKFSSIIHYLLCIMYMYDINIDVMYLFIRILLILEKTEHVFLELSFLPWLQIDQVLGPVANMSSRTLLNPLCSPLTPPMCMAGVV